MPLKWRRIAVRSICQHGENVPVTLLRRTPAAKPLAPQLPQVEHEQRLCQQPAVVKIDDFLSVTILADDERVAPLAGTSDVDVILSSLAMGNPCLSH
jgi:hypothetical protein